MRERKREKRSRVMSCHSPAGGYEGEVGCSVGGEIAWAVQWAAPCKRQTEKRALSWLLLFEQLLPKNMKHFCLILKPTFFIKTCSCVFAHFLDIQLLSLPLYMHSAFKPTTFLSKGGEHFILWPRSKDFFISIPRPSLGVCFFSERTSISK